MSIEANKTVVQQFWAAFSAGHLDEALALLADDVSWWVAGELSISGTYSKTGFAELLKNVVPEFPKGITVTPTMLTAEDNRVAMEAISFGERANGRVYNNRYHFLHELRDGRIVAVREYMDTDHVNRILLL